MLYMPLVNFQSPKRVALTIFSLPVFSQLLQKKRFSEVLTLPFQKLPSPDLLLFKRFKFTGEILHLAIYFLNMLLNAHHIKLLIIVILQSLSDNCIYLSHVVLLLLLFFPLWLCFLKYMVF